MSECRVAILADDLTGALDAAAPFAERGAATRVVVDLDRLQDRVDAWQGDLPEVVAVTTESRHLTAEAAAKRVSRAATLLARLAPEVWFKKIDSTLRGQVVAECLALREACGRRLLLAPAVPAQGRTTRDARILVHGQPLDATDFARDARSRPPSGALDALFLEHGLPLMACRSGAELPTTDVVVDAESDAELEAWGRGGLDRGDEWLLVGAAGLGRALSQTLLGPPSRPLSWQGYTGLWLAVGSRSERAREQVEALCRALPALPVRTAGADVPVETPFLLLLPEAGDGDREAEEVAASLASALVDGMTMGENRLGLVTGGDIASAVMARLDASYMEVAGEWEAGIVLGYPQGNTQWPLLTKAGGFGDETLFVRLLRSVSGTP